MWSMIHRSGTRDGFVLVYRIRLNTLVRIPHHPGGFYHGERKGYIQSWEKGTSRRDLMCTAQTTASITRILGLLYGIKFLNEIVRRCN